MSTNNKKKTSQHFLSYTAQQHFKTLEHGIDRYEIIAHEDEWSYSDFVVRLLMVLVMLRLKEEQNCGLSND